MEMEVVSGLGEDATPKACSTQQLGSAEVNGVRVSVNGEQTEKVNGSGDVVVVEEKSVNGSEDVVVVKTKSVTRSKDVVVVETRSVNGSGDVVVVEEKSVHSSVVVVEEKSENGSVVVEDSVVMNEVSSLLKLKEDKEVDGDEEEEEKEHGYRVGDFVWGKVKNHPWWPGQIYEPSEASELALKVKQKGKLLVAYFGDGSFAWCSPSQLKPFSESFKECSKGSNSRDFVGAVAEAVGEIGRHIERMLTCDCVEQTNKFDNKEAKNSGIKEGVVVHCVRREVIMSLVVGYPDDLVEDVKGFGETISCSDLLELEIMKRKMSAFYRSYRGYGLREYHGPQSVPGLEDKNKDDEDDNNEEEEVLDSESRKKPLEQCSGFSDPRLHHKRKEKSIAELLDTTATTPKSRSVNEISAIEDVEKGKTLSRKKKTKKKDDVNEKKNDEKSGDREESDDVEETEKNEVSDADLDIDSTPLASLRKRVRVDASSVEKTAGNGESGTLSSKRERKKSKYFSPEFLSDFPSKGRKRSKNESVGVSSESQVGEQVTDASESFVAAEDNEPALDRPLEPALACLSHQQLSQELSNAVGFLRLGATPKEMGDLVRVAALGTEYLQDSSSSDMLREFMFIYRSFTFNDGANSRFLGSYKEKEELNESGKGEESREKNQQTDETEKHGTTKKERKPKKTISKKQGDAEEEETLKESIESAKKERKLKKLKSKKQADDVEEVTLKESVESAKKERKRKKQADEGEETLKESSESTKKMKKPKKLKSKKQADDEEEVILKESSEPTKKERKPKSKKQADVQEEVLSETAKKERKRKKPQNEEEEMLTETEKSVKKKKAGKTKNQEVDDAKIETEKAISGAELVVTFGPGSSLPKKEDLIEIYKKFGALDEGKTYMYVNNSYASVVFLNITDGEKAFESSQEKCPFASANGVKFRLKYPNEKTEEKKGEAEVAETATETEYVKKKLEEMRVLIGETGGGMSEEVKAKLEDEMVSLLETVRKMKST